MENSEVSIEEAKLRLKKLNRIQQILQGEDDSSKLELLRSEEFKSYLRAVLKYIGVKIRVEDVILLNSTGQMLNDYQDKLEKLFDKSGGSEPENTINIIIQELTPSEKMLLIDTQEDAPESRVLARYVEQLGQSQDKQEREIQDLRKELNKITQLIKENNKNKQTDNNFLNPASNIYRRKNSIESAQTSKSAGKNKKLTEADIIKTTARNQLYLKKMQTIMKRKEQVGFEETLNNSMNESFTSIKKLDEDEHVDDYLDDEFKEEIKKFQNVPRIDNIKTAYSKMDTFKRVKQEVNSEVDEKIILQKIQEIEEDYEPNPLQEFKSDIVFWQPYDNNEMIQHQAYLYLTSKNLYCFNRIDNELMFHTQLSNILEYNFTKQNIDNGVFQFKKAIRYRDNEEDKEFISLRAKSTAQFDQMPSNIENNGERRTTLTKRSSSMFKQVEILQPRLSRPASPDPLRKSEHKKQEKENEEEDIHSMFYFFYEAEINLMGYKIIFGESSFNINLRNHLTDFQKSIKIQEKNMIYFTYKNKFCKSIELSYMALEEARSEFEAFLANGIMEESTQNLWQKLVGSVKWEQFIFAILCEKQEGILYKYQKPKGEQKVVTNIYLKKPIKLRGYKLKEYVRSKIYPERPYVLVLRHLDSDDKIELAFANQPLQQKWKDILKQFTHKKRPLPPPKQ